MRVDEAYGGSFSALADAIDPIRGRVFDPLRVLDLERLRFEDLLFGFHLGLLDAKWMVRIETERCRRGYRGDSRQSELVAMLTSDAQGVERLVRRVSERVILRDPRARKTWLRAVLQLLLESWASGHGDPLIESTEVLSAWGDDGRDVWEAIRPRGFDSLVFGKSARRRFVRRTYHYLGSDS